MTDSAIRLAVKLVTTLVVAGECHSAQQEEPACRPAADLRPQASAGNPASVPSDLTPNGTLLRWTAGVGETLKLRLFTAEPGTYELSLSAVHAPDAPVVSAKLWEDPLTRKGDPSIALQWGTGPTVRAVRFDDVPMGPGHHILQLTCLEPGDILLDCVALRRTGELVVPRGGDATGGRPFLGIQMQDTGEGGVTIQRTVSGSGAEEAGLEAGDVLVQVNGEPVGTSGDVVAAILRHRPGDRIQLTLIRDGELIERAAMLGRRSESERRGGSRATSVIIDVLGVMPGQVIADIGAGTGWLSEAIAEAVGTDGIVYAVEVQESHVRRLHRFAFPNVVPVLSVPDDVSLPQDSLDTAMLHDVASHVKRSARSRFYQSVARALRPDGRLVIFGPHGKARKMLNELREYGFVPVEEEEPADLDQWLADGIVFRYAPAGSE